MRSYEYRHRVCFEETNVVGNVYYANLVRWQGRCREMFLYEHLPELALELGQSTGLVTTRVSCSFYRELSAFDEVLIRMTAGSLTQNRLLMRFAYMRVRRDGGEEMVAEGEQEVACIRREGANVTPIPLPAALIDVVERYIFASGTDSGNGWPRNLPDTWSRRPPKADNLEEALLAPISANCDETKPARGGMRSNHGD
jgi:enediyne core biosynthesis thioesterase